MDFNQIQELIRMVSKHKISEFILKDGEFKLEIRNNTGNENTGVPMVMPMQQPMMAMPALSATQAPVAPIAEAFAPPEPPKPANDDAKYVAIKSPMVGTFYRSSSPDKPPLVKIGDTVDSGTKVCVIEAMKLFNDIESEIKGKIVKVLVEDSTPVEYDQPLFLVDPS